MPLYFLFYINKFTRLFSSGTPRMQWCQKVECTCAHGALARYNLFSLLHSVNFVVQYRICCIHVEKLVGIWSNGRNKHVRIKGLKIDYTVGWLFYLNFSLLCFIRFLHTEKYILNSNINYLFQVFRKYFENLYIRKFEFDIKLFEIYSES